MKFKHFFLFSALLLSASGVVGCSNSGNEEAAGPEAISVDSLHKCATQFVGDTVIVEGLCTHICKHGGTKAFLVNPDTTAGSSVTILCKATDKIRQFSKDCPGQKLVVMGIWNEIKLYKSEIEARVVAEAEKLEEKGHCDNEQRANGTAAQWLDALNAQIAAGGDTILVVGHYLNAFSYSVEVK